MKFYREEYSDWKIEFAYSPFFEMACSLHVLSNPDHHIGRLKWAENIYKHIDEKLLIDINYFGKHYYGWCSMMEFCEASNVVNSFSIIEAIEYIETLDINQFVYYLLNKDISINTIKNVLYKKNTSLPKGLNDEQKSLFNKPESIRSRLINCLKEYYYLYFQDELKAIEPLLIRTLKRHKIYSEKMDFLDFINTLHERIEVNKTQFHFHKYKRFDVSFDEIKKIVIKASTFIGPHLLIGLPDDNILKLTIRVNPWETNPYEIPSDLHRILKALADQTRLKIIKNIYKNPSCTQSLAKNLNLTEACISKHLKVLDTAGLVYKKRKGNFIIYSVDSMAIDRIPMDLYQYLDE